MIQANIAVLYDQYATHTNTVFQHLDCFRSATSHRIRYFHGEGWAPKIDLNHFDVVLIHYSLRVAYKVIPDALFAKIQKFSGLKILFVQDEYDLTDNTIQAINELAVDWVYTCVPEHHRNLVYSPDKIRRGVKFIETLTGFTNGAVNTSSPKVKERGIDIGYRGRALPFWYGDLGQEKLEIAKGVKKYFQDKSFNLDIEWTDDERLYGNEWVSFLQNSKVVLGSESGCNIFDFDGSVRVSFTELLKQSPQIKYSEARTRVLGPGRETPIMNQISPRIFEAAENGAGLCLFEGEYSGLIRPYEHFFPLKKNFSNLDDLADFIRQPADLQAMVDRTASHLILNKKLSIRYFAAEFSKQVSLELTDRFDCELKSSIFKEPEGNVAPFRFVYKPPTGILHFLWHALPSSSRKKLKPFARKLWDAIQSK